MQGTCLPLHLLTKVAFELCDRNSGYLPGSLTPSHKFGISPRVSYTHIGPYPCVTDLGLEVEAFREAMCGCSSLGYRVRVDLIGQDCELEISEILVMVDPRGGSHLVGCGCTVWSFTTLGECGLSLSLGLRPMKIHSSNQEIKSN